MEQQIKTAPAKRWYLELRMQEKWRMPAYQAFRILHVGFIVAPILAGADKFLHYLTNWTQYLAPVVTRAIPMSPSGILQTVGVVEIAAGLLVAFKPKIGGYVVAGWLAAIIVNLLLIPGYFDVALRDFGLMLGAIALARLARHFE
jgi:hypothetical protein